MCLIYIHGIDIIVKESKNYNAISDEYDELVSKVEKNIESIKESTEKLTKVFYELSEKLYSAQAATGDNVTEATSDNGEAKEGTVYDADYKVEDDNNDNN